MTWLIYHMPEDAHLVRPLRHFLELSGLDCTCHEKPVHAPFEGVLVICGESFADQEWLKRIIDEDPDAILVMLARVDFDLHHGTAIDLRTWPSRTADKALVTLVDWLKKGRHGTFEAALRPPPPAPKSPSWLSENRTVVILLLAVLAGLIALVSVEPQRVAPTSPAEAKAAAQGQRPLTDSRTRPKVKEYRRTTHDEEQRAESMSREEEEPAAIIRDAGCNGEIAFGCAVFSCDKLLHAEPQELASH